MNKANYVDSRTPEQRAEDEKAKPTVTVSEYRTDVCVCSPPLRIEANPLGGVSTYYGLCSACGTDHNWNAYHRATEEAGKKEAARIRKQRMGLDNKQVARIDPSAPAASAIEAASSLGSEVREGDIADSAAPEGGDAQILICDCNSLEHQVIIRQVEDEIYLCPRLVKKGFWRRLKAGLKFICGHTSKFGEWDEVILKPEDWRKFQEISLKLSKKRLEQLKGEEDTERLRRWNENISEKLDGVEEKLRNAALARNYGTTRSALEATGKNAETQPKQSL